MTRHRLLPLAVVSAVLVSAAACPPKRPDPPASAPHLVPAADPDADPTPAQPASFATAPPGARAVVLYTASVQGYVEPCGCTADPLGGIARLAATVEDARAAYGDRVLVLDAGDLLFEKLDDNNPADLCQTEARVDVLLDAHAENGLAATVLGPLDDVRGPAFRDARLAKRGILTLTLGARTLEAGAPAAPSLLKDAGGVKLGVVGVRLDDKAQLAALRVALESEIKKLLAQGAQATVLLAQAPRDLVRALATDLGGLDVVVLGRAPGEVPASPERLGARGPVMVASAHQAQHVGVIELALDGRAAGQALLLDDRAGEVERRRKVLDVRIAELNTQIAATEDAARRAFFEGRVATAEAERAALSVDAQPAPQGPHVVARAIALQRGMREQAKASSALASYASSIPALVARCEANATCPEPKPGEPTYVGAATCKACHEKAWTFWQQQEVKRPSKAKDGSVVERTLGHARAWRSLTDDKKESDRTCVGCHSVGFNAPGGACKTSEIVKRGLEGVQCESCHGPGSMHVALVDKTRIARAPTEAQCRACHQVPHIETTASFVFEDKLKMILGPGHGAPAPKAVSADGGTGG